MNRNEINTNSDHTISNDDRSQNPISGFWVRIFAHIIDIILLGIIGVILSITLSGILIRMGIYGWVVSFGIVTLYYGLMNSRLTGGQTLGKMINNIRVSNLNGEPISVKRSLLRALFFSYGLIFWGGIYFILYLNDFSKALYSVIFLVL